jgi:transposase
VSKRPKKYPPEFRARAVRLAQESEKPIAEVARDLGVAYQTLYEWVSQARKAAAAPAKEPGAPLSAEEEVRQLRRQLDEVTMERDFLKKAAAYFAKVTK